MKTNTAKEMKPTEIAEMIAFALREHRATRDALAEAIVTMLEPLPNGTTIKTPSHTVEMRQVFCGCSQWANSTWDVTGEADGYLVDWDLIRDERPSVWDGHNCHHRRTPLYLSVNDHDIDDDDGIPGHGPGLRLATAKTLRSLARELPGAIAEYVARKQAETEETKAGSDSACRLSRERTGKNENKERHPAYPPLQSR